MRTQTKFKLILSIIFLAGAAFLVYFDFKGGLPKEWPSSISKIITFFAFIFSLNFILDIILDRRYPGQIQPYNIAIIGYPKSGKTTLIVSLFQEIFNRKISGIKAMLKGESTIERLNEQITKKESGLPVGPTNDQTMFAYRTNIETKGAFFKKEYKVEFGDYPGEYSEDLIQEQYFDELKKSEFFKWCIEANAYIFIIDVGRYLLTDNKAKFIAESSKAVRQSWQHFLDYGFDFKREINKKPILLIFNKMDLFELRSKSSTLNDDFVENKIKTFGFSEDMTPKVFELNSEEYAIYSKLLLDDFSDLISYLKSESTQFHILFTSNFGTLNKRFAGVHEILKYVLPSKLNF